VHLVVYGDFNCPYSYLASARADVLRSQSRADVEWRAVEHDPAIPRPSRPVDAELASTLGREVEEIRALLRPDERLPIAVPRVHANTASAIETFGATPIRARHELRRRLFAAYWSEAADIGDPSLVSAIAGAFDARASTDTRAWHRAWTSFDEPMVPMLILPSGEALPGIRALAWLGDVTEHGVDP
jgi:predicted DsbA family dithiol-disulfide isomerase